MRQFRSLPKLATGQTPTADEFNRLVDAVESTSVFAATNDLAITAIGKSISVSNVGPEVWDAQILAGPGITPDGCQGYQWIEVMKVGCSYVPFPDSRTGGFSDGTASGSGQGSGTGSGVETNDTSLYAVELNGNDNVPNGAIVRMWYAADAQSTEFEYCCGGIGTGSGIGSGPGNVIRILKCVMIVQAGGSGSGQGSGAGSGASGSGIGGDGI